MRGLTKAKEASSSRDSLEAAEQTRTNIIQNYPARRSRLTYFISGKGFCRGQGVETQRSPRSRGPAALPRVYYCTHTAVRNLVIVEHATSALRACTRSVRARVNFRWSRKALASVNTLAIRVRVRPVRIWISRHEAPDPRNLSSKLAARW